MQQETKPLPSEVLTGPGFVINVLTKNAGEITGENICTLLACLLICILNILFFNIFDVFCLFVEWLMFNIQRYKVRKRLTILQTETSQFRQTKI